MGTSWRLGRPFGIPVEFDVSGVVVAVIIAFTLATSAFPGQFPSFSVATNFILGVSAAVLLYASVLAHELSHALVARRDGLAVEGITLFAFGGVARLAEEPRNAGEELRMAAAGPACSLLLGGALFAVMLPLSQRGAPLPLLALLAYLAAINIALGIFNLVPGFPLDGGRILRALIWGTTRDIRRATWASAGLGQGVGLLLVFWGIFRVFEVVQDLSFSMAWVSGLFLMLTGVFLWEAARRSYQLVLQRGAVPVEASDDRDIRLR